MNIKHPELIPLIILIPACVVFLYFTWQKRKKVLAQLCMPSKLRSLFPYSTREKNILRYSLLILACAMFVIALISPRWGYDWKQIETKGSNIYIALDVSESMLAEDISPNRLTRARLELSDLIDMLTGDRVGLIIFAGEAFLQSPLTHDYLMIKDWLNQIEVGSVQVPGTSVKLAILMAINHFSYIKSESKALIIVSDGEDHDNETLEIARRAKSAGIKIFCIGVGTNKGAPISYQGSLIKDSNGNVVVSKLNDTLLKEVAEVTGGKYTRSTTGDFDLKNLYYEHIKNAVSSETLKSGKTKLWFETYQIFAGVALMALLLEALLNLNLNLGLFANVKNKENIFNRAKTVSTITFLIAVSCVISEAKANILDLDLIQGDAALKNDLYSKAKEHYLKVQVKEPHNPRLNYNFGIVGYRENDFVQAANHFSQSTKNAESKTLKEKAFYNLGNALYRLENYQDAVKAYESALAIIPDDEDAKYNLELARKKLEEQKKNQCQNPPNNPQNDKQEDKKDQNKNGKDKQNDKDEKKEKQDENKEEKKPDYDSLLKQVKEADPSELKNQKAPASKPPENSVKYPW